MRKIGLIFALLIVACLAAPAPAAALTLEDKAAGYKIELPAAWKPMNTIQLHQLAGHLATFDDHEARRQVISNARGAEFDDGSELGVSVIIMAIPYQAMGLDNHAVASMVDDLQKGGALALKPILEGAEKNALRHEVGFQKVSDRGYIITQRLWISVENPNLIINRTTANYLVKDYMIIYIGQYMGKPNPASDKDIQRAIETIQIAPGKRLVI